jgi:hypothetical protein
MEPTARKKPDGTVTVDRDGFVFEHMLRYFETQNAGELPKEETARRQLLEEARYYEARDLVRVLSGQIQRHETIGPDNIEMAQTEDMYRNLFAQHRDDPALDDKLLTMIDMYDQDGQLSAKFNYKHFHAGKDADRFAIILRGNYKVPRSGPSAVPTVQEFKREFNSITNNLFVGFDFRNVSESKKM